MEKRKRITPVQRARQRVSRVNALHTAVSYERKIRTNRTRGIKASLDDLMERKVPPVLWADEIGYSEAWMNPLLTDMYLTIGHKGAVEVANRLLAKKADTTDVFTRALLQWAQTYLGQRITLMGQTISTWLRDTLVAIYNGTTEIVVDGVVQTIANSSLGVEKLTKMLYAETMNKWDAIKMWQCRRIAQTEAMNSMNVAGLEAAEALGIPYEKTWSISGINTRETHEAVDGITLPQGGLFTVGGYPMERPMDDRFGAPAGEVINCACTLIYLPADNGITEI
jgi:hypothetical protein